MNWLLIEASCPTSGFTFVTCAFTRLAALESGTPVMIGGGVGLALHWLRYFAGWADKIKPLSMATMAKRYAAGELNAKFGAGAAKAAAE